MGPTVRKFYDEIQRDFEGFAALQAEVAALVKQREDQKRFLDINAEKAELARLQEEKAGILAKAEAERDRMLGQARADAEEIQGKARTTAEQVAGGILARANADSDTVRGEARSIVQAAQGEARRIVGAAQGQALQLTREAEAANATAGKALEDAKLAHLAVADREKAVTQRERELAVAEQAFQQRKDTLLASLAR